MQSLVTLLASNPETTRVPRSPAMNFQDPGLLMRIWDWLWQPRRRSLTPPRIARSPAADYTY